MTGVDRRHLMSAQEIVASGLSDRGVTVLFDAEYPHVDIESRTIHLRPLPESLSDEAIEDVRGDCDHEVGHLLFTTPEAFLLTERRFVHVIANAIEDGRIERLVANEWIGCGENLERSGARAIASIAAFASDEPRNVLSRAICALSLLVYGATVDSASEKLGADIEPLLGAISDLLPDLSSCASTVGVIEIASKIAGRWSPDGIWDDVAEDEEVSQQLIAASSPATVRKATVGEIATTGRSVGTYLPYTEKDTETVIQYDKRRVEAMTPAFFDSVRKTVPALRGKLLASLRTPGKKLVRHQRRGDIDDRALHRAGTDSRLFRSEVRGLTNRVAVSLLVDCSVSMNQAAEPTNSAALPPKTRLLVAAQAAAAIAAVLDILRIPCECLAFTTVRKPVKQKSGFSRSRPLKHLVVKPFNKSFHASKPNFVGLGLYDDCAENIDGEAVMWAARRLSQRAANDVKPVLIVFSDGAPASQPEDQAVLASHLSQTVARITRTGIGLIGVGVGSDSVAKFYPDHIVIDDVTQLIERSYKLIAAVIEKSSSAH